VQIRLWDSFFTLKIRYCERYAYYTKFFSGGYLKHHIQKELLTRRLDDDAKNLVLLKDQIEAEANSLTDLATKAAVLQSSKENMEDELEAKDNTLLELLVMCRTQCHAFLDNSLSVKTSVNRLMDDENSYLHAVVQVQCLQKSITKMKIELLRAQNSRTALFDVEDTLLSEDIEQEESVLSKLTRRQHQLRTALDAVKQSRQKAEVRAAHYETDTNNEFQQSQPRYIRPHLQCEPDVGNETSMRSTITVSKTIVEVS
jgi:chromosome segregation ATPase